MERKGINPMTLQDEGGTKGKREAIIEAAAKVFASKGFHSARVEEIAREADVGKGTVYEYFDSKEDLFKKMIDYISSKQIKFLMSDFHGMKNVAEQIERIILEHLNFMQEHKKTAKLVLSDHFTLSEEMRKWLVAKRDEKIDFIRDLIAKGIKTGEFRADIDPNTAAHLVFGATAAVGGSVVTSSVSRDIETVARELKNIIFEGLKS